MTADELKVRFGEKALFRVTDIKPVTTSEMPSPISKNPVPVTIVKNIFNSTEEDDSTWRPRRIQGLHFTNPSHIFNSTSSATGRSERDPITID